VVAPKMTLATSVYTAFRGYGWSSVPPGLSLHKLDQLHGFVSAARGDFPDPLSVEVGLVSDGQTVAAFTIQNVDQWDSEKRSSEYAAFAFFSTEQAADIDFIALLNNDFFWTPTRETPMSLEYSGSPSEPVSSLEMRNLVTNHVCLLRNPRTVGSFFSRYGTRSSHWVCLLKAENILKIECADWKIDS